MGLLKRPDRLLTSVLSLLMLEPPFPMMAPAFCKYTHTQSVAQNSEVCERGSNSPGRISAMKWVLIFWLPSCSPSWYNYNKVPYIYILKQWESLPQVQQYKGKTGWKTCCLRCTIYKDPSWQVGTWAAIGATTQPSHDKLECMNYDATGVTV